MTRLVTFGETALTMSPPDHERLAGARDLELRVSGTESNVAVAADRLGCEATWLSRVPETPLGERVVGELHERGLETDVVWAPSADERQGLVFGERGASPREARTIEDRSAAAAAQATPGDLSMTLVQNASAVFVGGATAALSETALETTEAILRAARGTRVFDLDYRPGLWSPEEARAAIDPLLDAVDVFVATESDVTRVLDRSGKPRELVHNIAADRDFDVVVVTRGDRGAIAWDDSVIHEQEPFPVETVDPAGHHDAFVGGFLAAHVRDDPTDEALATGTAAAALTRTTPGAMTSTTSREVERVIADHGDDGPRR